MPDVEPLGQQLLCHTPSFDACHLPSQAPLSNPSVCPGEAASPQSKSALFIAFEPGTARQVPVPKQTPISASPSTIPLPCTTCALGYVSNDDQMRRNTSILHIAESFDHAPDVHMAARAMWERSEAQHQPQQQHLTFHAPDDCFSAEASELQLVKNETQPLKGVEEAIQHPKAEMIDSLSSISELKTPVQIHDSDIRATMDSCTSHTMTSDARATKQKTCEDATLMKPRFCMSAGKSEKPVGCIADVPITIVVDFILPVAVHAHSTRTYSLLQKNSILAAAETQIHCGRKELVHPKDWHTLTATPATFDQSKISSHALLSCTLSHMDQSQTIPGSKLVPPGMVEVAQDPAAIRHHIHGVKLQRLRCTPALDPSLASEHEPSQCSASICSTNLQDTRMNHSHASTHITCSVHQRHVPQAKDLKCWDFENKLTMNMLTHLKVISHDQPSRWTWSDAEIGKCTVAAAAAIDTGTAQLWKRHAYQPSASEDIMMESELQWLEPRTNKSSISLWTSTAVLMHQKSDEPAHCTTRPEYRMCIKGIVDELTECDLFYLPTLQPIFNNFSATGLSSATLQLSLQHKEYAQGAKIIQQHSADYTLQAFALKNNTGAWQCIPHDLQRHYEHHIAYTGEILQSTKLTLSARNQDIVCVCKYFAKLSRTHTFILQTDHLALQWLFSTKEQTAVREYRQSERGGEYSPRQKFRSFLEASVSLPAASASCTTHNYWQKKAM